MNTDEIIGRLEAIRDDLADMPGDADVAPAVVRVLERLAAESAGRGASRASVTGRAQNLVDASAAEAFVVAELLACSLRGDPLQRRLEAAHAAIARMSEPLGEAPSVIADLVAELVRETAERTDDKVLKAIAVGQGRGVRAAGVVYLAHHNPVRLAWHELRVSLGQARVALSVRKPAGACSSAAPPRSWDPENFQW